jgi:hypothetical protein
MKFSPPAFSAPSRIGNYRLLRELALGSDFRIDLAIAPGVPNAPAVAVKRLRHDSAWGRERLLREARVGAGLRSANLLRVMDVGGFSAEPGIAEPFVALEYVPGASLHMLLAYARPRDLRHALAAILGALRGLDSLHRWSDEQGNPGYLVHQAPTARHILVGLDGVSRLIDLSHLQGRLLGKNRGAGQGLLPSELAPEQRQACELDPRCDVFIAGATLRNVLARCAPLERAQLAPLDAVWQRATAPHRGDRFWCAQEMAFALQSAAMELELASSAAELAAWVLARVSSEVASDEAAARARSALASSYSHEAPRTSPPPALFPALSEREEFAACRPPLAHAGSPTSAPISAPLPIGERCSGLGYTSRAERADEVAASAHADTEPPPARRRIPPWSALRALAGGAGLGALVLGGFVAIGASQRDEPLAPQANRSSLAQPVEHSARPSPVFERSVDPPAAAARAPQLLTPVVEQLPSREPQPQAAPPSTPERKVAPRRPRRFSLYGVPENPF